MSISTLRAPSSKFYLIVGCFVGFLLAFIGGVNGGNEIGYILRNASIGSVVGVLIVKALQFIFTANLQTSAREKIKREAAQNEKAL